MEKISIKFNGTGGVRIDQSISLKEKAAKYDETTHILPADYTMRKDYQTLEKLYDNAIYSDNAIYAYEFEKLKSYLLENQGGGIVLVNGIEEN